MALVTDYWHLINRLADALLAHKTLTFREVTDLLADSLVKTSCGSWLLTDATAGQAATISEVSTEGAADSWAR